jgi:hypothetical protein
MKKKQVKCKKCNDSGEVYETIGANANVLGNYKKTECFCRYNIVHELNKTSKDLSNNQLVETVKKYTEHIKHIELTLQNNTSVYSDNQLKDIIYRYNKIKSECEEELNNRGVYELLIKYK